MNWLPTEEALIVEQILLNITKGNVWRWVWRIFIQMLVWKGFVYNDHPSWVCGKFTWVKVYLVMLLLNLKNCLFFIYFHILARALLRWKYVNLSIIILFDGFQVIGYLNLLANSIDNFTHGLAVAGSFVVSTKVSCP